MEELWGIAEMRLFTGQMTFLSVNRQSTETKSLSSVYKSWLVVLRLKF